MQACVQRRRQRRDAMLSPGPYGYYGSNYGWDPSCEAGYGEYYNCGSESVLRYG